MRHPHYHLTKIRYNIDRGWPASNSNTAYHKNVLQNNYDITLDTDMSNLNTLIDAYPHPDDKLTKNPKQIKECLDKLHVPTFRDMLLLRLIPTIGLVLYLIPILSILYIVRN